MSKEKKWSNPEPNKKRIQNKKYSPAKERKDAIKNIPETML